MILRPLKYPVHRLGRRYVDFISRREAAENYRFNERPIEYSFVFEQLAAFAGSRILDVGTGTSALPSIIRGCGFEIVAIDPGAGYWPGGLFNRHFPVERRDILSGPIEGFDMVLCVSTLEHIYEDRLAVKNMLASLLPGGKLLLSFPYNEHHYLENVYEHPSAGYGHDLPYICRVYSRQQICRWIEGTGCRVTAHQYWRVFTGEFWTFGERLRPAERTGPTRGHQLACIAIEKSHEKD